MRNNKRGFTLLEILLVVGIIAILAGIVIVAINPSKQLATVRNAERKSDLKQLDSALTQYYIDKFHYPTSLTSSLTEICDTGALSTTTGSSIDCTGLIDLTPLVPLYITAIPKDPQASTTYGAGYSVVKNTSTNKIGLSAPAELGESITVGVATTTTQADPIVTSLLVGLRGYFILDSDLSDSSGYNNNGSNSGVTFANSGILGHSGLFSGNYFTIANSSSLNMTGSFTYNLWVKRAAGHIDGNNQLLVGNGRIAPGNLDFMFGGLNNLVICVNYVACYDSSGVVTDTAWHMASLSFDGSLYSFYLDGSPVGTYSRSTTLVNGNYYIGGSNTSYPNPFYGDIDEVGMWNRVLSGTEISNLYNSGSGRSLIQ